MLALAGIQAGARHYDRGYESTPTSPFIQKGTWSIGGTAKYSQHINDNYNYLVIGSIQNIKGISEIKSLSFFLFRDSEIKKYTFLIC